MQARLSERLQYRYEQFIGKGGGSIFLSLLILFIVGFALVWLGRLLLNIISPDDTLSEGTGGLAWRTFMEMIDAGTLDKATENGIGVKVVSTISILIGLIVFSALVAILTTALDTTIANFRKGKGAVLESGHTLILGWNERVADIVKELIIANESNKSASIVILADGIEKEAMDDDLNSKIDDFKTTKVITSPGSTSSLSELKRVAATEAKSVIILAKCSESATTEEKEYSDNLSVKVIMALRALQQNQNSLPIVVEIFGQDKRDIVRFFNDDNIVTIDSWNIMGKLMVQTSLTSGLEMIYQELFGFEGSEMYFYQADWGNIAFYDLLHHFKDGIPLGIYRPQAGVSIKDSIIIRPEKDTMMQEGDEILILANDDSAISYLASPITATHKLPLSDKVLSPGTRSMLMLGWHDISEIIIRESGEYLEEGTVIDVVFNEPDDDIKAKIEALQADIPKFKLNLIDSNAMKMEELRTLQPLDYEVVMILSQMTGDLDPEKVDADTLMLLLMLRRIRKEMGKSKEDTKILTQILNSENQELIHQTDVDDFLISNKLITKILAQLSEQPKLQWVYNQLFEADGSEIYVKPADLYISKFPQSCTFVDICEAARQREEICMGLRLHQDANNPDKNFGIVLNPPKDAPYTLTAQDYLIVISENER